MVDGLHGVLTLIDVGPRSLSIVDRVVIGLVSSKRLRSILPRLILVVFGIVRPPLRFALAVGLAGSLVGVFAALAAVATVSARECVVLLWNLWI